jgi:hypothetical protein
MASHFGLKELFDQVSALLPTKGVMCEHIFGARGLSDHRNTNTYVWVPREGRRGGSEATRAVTTQKINFGARHFLEIHCWGETHEVAFLMGENVLAAIRDCGLANVEFERADWLDFEERGKSELGEPFVVQVSMGQAFIRRYTPIAPYTGDDQTVIPPDAPTTDPTSVQITTYATTDPNADGEQMGSINVSG